MGASSAGQATLGTASTSSAQIEGAGGRAERAGRPQSLRVWPRAPRNATGVCSAPRDSRPRGAALHCGVLKGAWSVCEGVMLPFSGAEYSLPAPAPAPRPGARPAQPLLCAPTPNGLAGQDSHLGEEPGRGHLHSLETLPGGPACSRPNFAAARRPPFSHLRSLRHQHRLLRHLPPPPPPSPSLETEANGTTTRVGLGATSFRRPRFLGETPFRPRLILRLIFSLAALPGRAGLRNCFFLGRLCILQKRQEKVGALESSPQGGRGSA